MITKTLLKESRKEVVTMVNWDRDTKFYRIIDKQRSKSKYLEGLVPTVRSKQCTNFVEVAKWANHATSKWIRIQWGKQNYVVIDSGVIEDLHKILRGMK